MATPRTARQKEVRRHLLVYAGLTPFLVIAVFPIYWMVITAFKQEPDLYRSENIPFWFNMAPTLKNFNILFHQTNYGAWIVNTMTIATWVAIITLLTAVPAGYALARLRLPGAENIGIAIFMTYLVPGIILFLPLSRVVATLGLQDSWWALVLVYPTFTVPFCTWLMMGFFKTVPMEMEEAARVDGCGQLGAFIRVVLPVSVPGVLTAVIFAFTLSMQDFLYGLAFVSPGDQKPVPVGVPTELIRGDVYFWGSLMGAALLVGLPVDPLQLLPRPVHPGDHRRRGEVEPLLRFGLLHRSRAAGIADMEHQILDWFVGAVRVVVPPAAVVHERLPGGVVLGARDADGPRLVKGRQDPVDDVDVGRHPELLAPGLPTRLKVHRGACQKDRGIDGGAEASERGDEGLDRNAFRVLRVLGVDGLAREADEKRHDEGERHSGDHFGPLLARRCEDRGFSIVRET